MDVRKGCCTCCVNSGWGEKKQPMSKSKPCLVAGCLTLACLNSLCVTCKILPDAHVSGQNAIGCRPLAMAHQGRED